MEVAAVCHRNNGSTGDHKLEGGTRADLKTWGEALANSGCSKMLEHLESGIADGDCNNIARCGACAAGA